ncbi:MAG: trigger factor [Pirellulales bacterium]
MAEDLTDLAEDEGAAEAEEPQRMDLTIKIDKPSACERHITVTISEEDVQRYRADAFSDLVQKASVPGFRAGRAPRKLVESRFRKEVNDQIKGSLLMDSMGQVNEDEELAAISEPDLDYEAVEVPDEGPMTFEFDLEVRPDFELPKWKGLKIERPTREFTSDDVDRQMNEILSRYSKLKPHDGAAEKGDYVVCNITTSHEGQQINRGEEETVLIRNKLSLHDGTIEDFDKLMVGCVAGDKKSATANLTEDAANEEIRGRQVDIEFEVLEVKRLDKPKLTEEFLSRLGDFSNEGDLRDVIKQSLERQLQYRQQKKIREQITNSLTESADWELPPELLKRQSERELQRAVLELQRSGFGEQDIKAYANELRQNLRQSTARALREHFILERIAEHEEIDVEPEDYDEEVMLIAMQSGDTPRKVRAQLEKRGMMDSLRNQIIERKVLAMVEEAAQFNDVPFEEASTDVAALDFAAGGESKEIPEVTEKGTPDTAAAYPASGYRAD